MATFVTAPDRLRMTDVTWAMYDHFSEDFGHGATRIIYDNGEMEVMTVGYDHGNVKTIAARLIETWAYEKDWPLTGLGNMTLRREDLQVGLEPDECYYVTTPPPAGSVGALDLTIYPVPDLAIEVEITRSSLSKASIYARLGVTEIFRWTGDRFVVRRRQGDGTYVDALASGFLPDLPVDVLGELTRLGIEQGQPAALRALRDRLRPA